MYSHLRKKLEDQSIEKFDCFFEQKTATSLPILVANMVAKPKSDGGKEESKEFSSHLKIVKMLITLSL